MQNFYQIFALCFIFLSLFSPPPSRSLIFQSLLQQKTSTLRSMLHLVEYSAGTVCCSDGTVCTLICKVSSLEWCVFSPRMYIKHGSPVKMMEAYVTVLTKGICQSDENGSFLIKDYDVRKAYLAGSVKGKTSSQPLRGTLVFWLYLSVICVDMWASGAVCGWWWVVDYVFLSLSILCQMWCLSLAWRLSSCTPLSCWRRGSLSITLGLKRCWSLQGALKTYIQSIWLETLKL